MIRKINSIEYAYLKSIQDQKLITESNNIIIEGWFGNLLDKTKNAFKKVGSVIAKVGEAIGGWITAVWDLSKHGVLLATGFISGKFKKDYDSLINENKQVQTAMPKVLPFMKGVMETTEKVGSDTNKNEFQDVKDSVKGKTITEANGSVNVDEKIKNLGQSLWKKLKSPIVEAFGLAKQEAKKEGQALAKKAHKDANKKSQQNKSQQKQETKKQNTQVTTEQIQFINTKMNELSHELHNLIIQWVYKGFTPKMIMQYIDGDYSTTKQKDLIIQGKNLSFKTNNGYLICQETDLKTNNQIIWESNTKFKGNHIIFEQTKNQYCKFKHIISQSVLKQQNQLINKSAIDFIFMVWPLISGTVLSLLKGIWHAISAAIAALTVWICGAGGAASQVGNAVATPVQSGVAAGAGAATTTGSLMGNVTDAVSKAKTVMNHINKAEQIVDTGKELLGKKQDKKEQSSNNDMQTIDPSSIPEIGKNDLGIDLNKLI